MAENDGEDRTEQPTARRRQEARDQGNVPRSVELSAAAVLLAGAAGLSLAGGNALGAFATRVLRESAGALSAGEMTPQGAAFVIRGLVGGLLVALAPFALGVVAISVVVNLAQTGASVSWKAVTPKFSKLNPASGVQRLFSPDALVNLLKAALKLTLLSFVTWTVLRQHWGELLALVEAQTPVVAQVLRALTFRLAFVTGFAFLGVAAADYAWQRYRHEKSLRMTKQEVRHEFRDMEGDPQNKARIRTMQRQRARSRMFQAVPKADVVITNPTHIAIALRFAPEESPAPIVVAMGERKLAERIKEIARRSNVPLVENKPVARALLATCTIGKSIPPALYAAVAEILAFVYRQRGGWPHASAARSSS